MDNYKVLPRALNMQKDVTFTELMIPVKRYFRLNLRRRAIEIRVRNSTDFGNLRIRSIFEFIMGVLFTLYYRY